MQNCHYCKDVKMILKSAEESVKREIDFSLHKVSLRMTRGFTLAETLITLTILGVVAAITVPSLINKQIESANRTKVKKAMAVYEKALNQMIENGDNNCRFKTADRVWWDITDIQNPIIAFKREDLNKEQALTMNTYKAFYFIGRYDDKNILRINDFASEVPVRDDDSLDSRPKNLSYLNKLYSYLGVIKTDEEVFFNKLKQQGIIPKEEINEYLQKECTDNRTPGKCYSIVMHKNGQVMGLFLSDYSTLGPFGNFYSDTANIRIYLDPNDNTTFNWCQNCDKVIDEGITLCENSTTAYCKK